MVRADQRVVIVFNDITRPVPSARILPVLLGELAHVPRESIVLLNALGTHRANTEEELQEILGAAIADGYTVAQHDAWDEKGLIELGRTSYGHRAAVNRLYYEADVRILTGFIEPHFFAGFSGGPKVVMPGIAGIDTIMNNHGYAMLREPSATWGRTEGNPVWEEIRQVASLAPPDLILNVTLNRRREITRVFAGELWRAHRAGVDYARETAMAPVEAPYDVVITTNSGYPLDINLYQAVKGMSCAAQIVKPGGAIILAAECRDGIPDYGEYRAIVQEAGSVAGIMEMIRQPDFRRHDQWEAQLQARVQERAKVYVYSDYLSDEQTRSMLLEPIESIEATLAALLEEHGPDARLCVLPEGPQTIPYLVQNGEIP
jgi:nickel-dependent lactate racemase